jgi:hypothetical protein
MNCIHPSRDLPLRVLSINVWKLTKSLNRIPRGMTDIHATREQLLAALSINI